MHILSPETDNCPSWISRRERMTVENISWSISTKECCRPRRGLNPRPPGLQLDGASNWATEAGYFCVRKLQVGSGIFHRYIIIYHKPSYNKGPVYFSAEKKKSILSRVTGCPITGLLKFTLLPPLLHHLVLVFLHYSYHNHYNIIILKFIFGENRWSRFTPPPTV